MYGKPVWETPAPPNAAAVDPMAAPSVPGPQPGAGGPGAVPQGSSTPAPASLGEVPKTGNTGLAAPSSSGFGDAASGILDFANKNPVVALGLLQAAGSGLSGAFSTLTPAQANAYNAQAAANDAAAAFTKSQTANLQMPKSVAASAPVTGTAQLVPIAAQPPPPAAKPGFINQAPVPSAPVTGVAA
jgi:hypothetical protein